MAPLKHDQTLIMGLAREQAIELILYGLPHAMLEVLGIWCHCAHSSPCAFPRACLSPLNRDDVRYAAALAVSRSLTLSARDQGPGKRAEGGNREEAATHIFRNFARLPP